MEHLPDVTLLCIVAINIIFIMATCVLNTGTLKHPKKKNMIIVIILLAINLIFDCVCFGNFVKQGLGENLSIFVLFIPITVFLLVEEIKEVCKISKTR